MHTLARLFEPVAPGLPERMALVVATMKELSRQTDPQEMGRAYSRRMRQLMPIDRMVSISRRDLEYPRYRVTRSTLWKEEVNPWKERDRLPLLEGGLFADWLYSDEPHLVNDLVVSPNDPAAEYLDGMRSLVAVPMYDGGAAVNMTLLMRESPDAFDPAQFPGLVWISNLFGRATHNLVLSEQLRQALSAVDYEMQVVADIQRSLLPQTLPKIPTLGVAAHYQTSQWAGGDYYDFFPAGGGKWVMLIADVSGHGTPAAVLMAVTHALVHTYPGPPDRPGELLGYVNEHLAAKYTGQSDKFVTAWLGVYDPSDRSLVYACAGHNPPRLKRCHDGTLALLGAVRGLPLGIVPGETFSEATHALVPGDQLVLYTDGITEAEGPEGELFGLERLDKVLENCSVGASDLLKSVLAAVEEFTGGKPPTDDRTVLVAKIS